MDTRETNQSSDTPSEDEPGMARLVLGVLGCLFLAFGVGMVATAEGDRLWGLLPIAAGILLLIAARYASATLVKFLTSLP